MLSIHWLYRRSRNSVVKILVLTSLRRHIRRQIPIWRASTFLDVTRWWRLLHENQTLQIKRYARKRLYHGFLVRIEISVHRDHCLASLGKASWWQTVPQQGCGQQQIIATQQDKTVCDDISLAQHASNMDTESQSKSKAQEESQSLLSKDSSVSPSAGRRQMGASTMARTPRGNRGNKAKDLKKISQWKGEDQPITETVQIRNQIGNWKIKKIWKVKAKWQSPRRQKIPKNL